MPRSVLSCTARGGGGPRFEGDVGWVGVTIPMSPLKKLETFKKMGAHGRWALNPQWFLRFAPSDSSDSQGFLRLSPSDFKRSMMDFRCPLSIVTNFGGFGDRFAPSSFLSYSTDLPSSVRRR